jgi:chloramphenicol-sensitive protein RarD
MSAVSYRRLQPRVSPSPQALPSSLPSPVFLAIICYAIWGFAPLIYLPMHAFDAGPLEIMAHRSLWAVICCAGLVYLNKQFPEVWAILKSPRVLGLLFISSLTLAANWGVFVWAVMNQHLIESSLGYYLNPLFNMAAGAFLFQERLDRHGLAAIGMAGIGVVIQGFALGHIPYIALFLALSFMTYGLIRKSLNVGALAGLIIECLFLIGPAIIYLVWFEAKGSGHFFLNPANSFWLMLSGPITVLPLALFAYVTRRMRLSSMGFIQFLGPTISFIIGLALGEAFSPLRGLSFVFIWGGAAVFAFGAWRRHQNLSLSAPKATAET